MIRIHSVSLSRCEFIHLHLPSRRKLYSYSSMALAPEVNSSTVSLKQERDSTKSSSGDGRSEVRHGDLSRCSDWQSCQDRISSTKSKEASDPLSSPTRIQSRPSATKYGQRTTEWTLCVRRRRGSAVMTSSPARSVRATILSSR